MMQNTKFGVLALCVGLVLMILAGCLHSDVVNARDASNSVGVLLTTAKAQLEMAYSDRMSECDLLTSDEVLPCAAKVDRDFIPITRAYRSLRATWLTFEAVLVGIEMGDEGELERLPELLIRLIEASNELRELVKVFLE